VISSTTAGVRVRMSVAPSDVTVDSRTLHAKVKSFSRRLLLSKCSGSAVATLTRPRGPLAKPRLHRFQQSTAMEGQVKTARLLAILCFGFLLTSPNSFADSPQERKFSITLCKANPSGEKTCKEVNWPEFVGRIIARAQRSPHPSDGGEGDHCSADSDCDSGCCGPCEGNITCCWPSDVCLIGK